MQTQTTVKEKIVSLYNMPLPDLIHEAYTVHKKHFPTAPPQLSTLVNIKSGSCPENCKYCAQSMRHEAKIEVKPMMMAEDVIEIAKRAKESGATRLCMGASGRSPKSGADFEEVLKMIRGVKEVGLETCVTLGLLTSEQAGELKEAGLTYYNHNLNTSPEYYQKIATSHNFKDRLNTIRTAQSVGIKVCTGGILGMGESREDRLRLIEELVKLEPAPDTIPINKYVAIPGTPLAKGSEKISSEFEDDEILRTFAVLRILLPKTSLRLGAGRMELGEHFQTLCFLAGVNSIFWGEELLTTENLPELKDREFLERIYSGR